MVKASTQRLRALVGVMLLTACTATPAGPRTGSGAPPPAGAARSGPPDQVTVALPVIAQSQAPYLIAREKGYYQDEGIEADLQVVAPNVGVQGAVAGSYAFTGAGGQAAIARLSGAPLRVIFNQNNSVTWWLVATQRSGVQTVENLKGKTIGIEGPGTLSATFTRAVLRKHGLNPDTDVEFISLGPVPNWLRSVISGAVDAGIAPDADALIVARQQGLTEVTWYGAEISAPLSGLATSESMLRDKPDLVKRFLRATIKGLLHYKANKEDAVALSAKLLDASPEEVARAYDILQPLTLSEPILDERIQREFLELAKDVLNVDRPVVPSDVYDYGITRQALQELTAEHWSPR